jgi:hypothetical protein
MKTHCSKNREYNCSEITTMKELMDHVCYSWGDNYNLTRLNSGELQLNKLTIGKDFVDYKTEYSPLKEGLFEKLEVFYELINNRGSNGNNTNN